MWIGAEEVAVKPVNAGEGRNGLRPEDVGGGAWHWQSRSVG